MFAGDFEQWLANDMFLDIDDRLFQENGYYLIDTVTDLKQLLAFGQDGALRFRLTDDLDLSNERDFYIPYLAGEFDGNGHRISNLNFDFGFVSNVGLFGYLASGGKVTRLGVENADITGTGAIGAVVGWADGTVSNSWAAGCMIRGGAGGSAGGLVGVIHRGAVMNSSASATIAGDWVVGGLVGQNNHGIVSNSYYNYDEVRINGKKIMTLGALFAGDFEQWLANDMFLDINERLSQEDGYYLIGTVTDFKQLLAFGQSGALRFRLTDDLDLSNERDFYIPYLAGEFDGNGHRISNLNFDFGFVSNVGLFGYLASGGKVTRLGVENASIRGRLAVGGVVGYNGWRSSVHNCYSSGSVSGSWQWVGGLVGWSDGSVHESYSTARVAGEKWVGGLVGSSSGAVSNSYCSGSVTAVELAGGLIGVNGWGGIVSNSYSTSSVAGERFLGGLVGHNDSSAAVRSSVWNTETSGQATSDGGTGKTTAEMMSIATFSGAGWNIMAVASAETRNTSRIWNIVEGQTYPFLSWQPVS